MPNWITTEIQTHPDVINALISADGKRVDFNRVIPFIGPHDFNMIDCTAEDFAKMVTKTPFDTHPLIGGLQQLNRDNLKFESLRDDQFEDFILMLRNFRACGYFHGMDFSIKNWDTKWNACESVFDIYKGTARFDTAWSYPAPVILALSSRFPDHEIDVRYADEDLGSNCGTLKLKGGQIVESNLAPSWHDMDESQRTEWRQFAAVIKGRELEED